MIKDKTYWELCIEINPVCMEVLADIIQTEFDCEGIITAEEKYKNLELIESTENVLKAYIVSDSLDFDEIKNFFASKRQEIIDLKIFNEDIGSWNVKINKIENIDWSKKWKEHWKPSKISDKIVICPAWEEYTPQADEIIIKIDPGNAFGTGAHATTQLCVKACEKYMKKGARIADIGTGSGILSICALKLGASSADAADTDETVIETAEKSAEMNGCSNIKFYNASSDALKSDSYDFVFANILHNVLAQITGDLKRIMKKGGIIVLSGILEGKEGVVLDAVKIHNLEVLEEMRQNEWIAFVCRK